MNKVVRSPTNIVNPASRRAALSFGSLKVIAALTDACSVLAASVSGFFIYQYYFTGILRFPGDSLSIGSIVAVLFVTVAGSRGFYQINTMINPIRNVKYIWLTIAIAILLLIGVLFILKVGDKHSRGSIVVFAALALGFVTLGRLTLARISTIGVQNGVIAGRRAVAVGAVSELDKILPYDLRRFGIEEVARVGLIQNEETMGLGERGRAQIGDAINLARDLRATEFVLIIPWAQEALLAEVGNLLRVSPLSVKLLPDSTIRRILGRQSNGGRDPQLSVEIQREPLNGWERLTKRALDLVLAVAAAVLLAPLLLMTAVAIKIDSNGPVLFRQRRVGFDNREFLIYKFRTMTVMDDGEAVVQAQRGDWRVTRIGKLLRRSSIDELPQLFNVIRGDMSIVGPRPHAVAHHDQYGALIASYALRHHVKPGLTGMAQIRGLRGETRQLALMERRVEQDLWYINHWSLTLDLMIMMRTCFVLLRHEVY